MATARRNFMSNIFAEDGGMRYRKFDFIYVKYIQESIPMIYIQYPHPKMYKVLHTMHFWSSVK